MLISPPRRTSFFVLVACCAHTLPAPVRAGTLEVGSGYPHATLAAALAAAKGGDTIRVHAPPDGAPYTHVALRIVTPDLTIIAAPDPAHANQPIRLSGEGFDFSGIGAVPRAIIQFEPGADHCTVEGFDLSGARNGSHNGAGVRINQASHIAIRACTIHDNDMGIMSNGNGAASAAVDQHIERCHIHDNGSTAEPGQNHNLYLGGTSVTVSACDIHSSTTGHNLKSRAHHTRVEYCWIHDAANRELDLVDGKGDTGRPDSDAVLLGCVIAKKPDTTGNRAVIHFGADGGHAHTGTLRIAHCTIITPFAAPVIDLSTPAVSAFMTDTLVLDDGRNRTGQALLAARSPSVGNAGSPVTAHATPRLEGRHNAFTPGFAAAAALGVTLHGHVEFLDPAHGDFRLRPATAALLPSATAFEGSSLPAVPGRDPPVNAPLRRYAHPASIAERTDAAAPAIGAAEAAAP